MLSRDALLADLSRALRAARPDSADDLLRETESNLSASFPLPTAARGAAEGGGPGATPLETGRQGEGTHAHRPRVTRGRLLEELSPLIVAAFPTRADTLLESLAHALWPAGVLGPAHVLADAPSASPDFSPDEWPSFVVIAPANSPHVGLRLLLHLESMTLGARPDLELPLPAAGLSPRHVQMTLDANGGVLLEDLSDGTGGLSVNGKPTSWAWMQDGDRVRCGAIEMRFVPALTIVSPDGNPRTKETVSS